MKLFSKDLLRYLPGQVGLALVAFVSVPVFTRVLSPEQFGRYALVMTSVAIMVTALGCFSMAMIRFYPAVRDEDVAVLVRSVFWVQLVLLAVTGTIVFVLSGIVWSNDAMFQRFVQLCLMIVAFEGMFQLLAQVLRARLQVGAYTFFTIWVRIAGLGLGIILAIHLQLGEVGILFGIALGLATALPFLWQKTFSGARAVGPVSMTLLRNMAWYGIPLVVGNFGGWLLDQSDRYLILSFYGNREVGIYSAAYSISAHSMSLLITLFALSSMPLLANTWEKQGQEASERLIGSVTRLYLLITIPAAAGLSFLAEPMMNVLTGSAFSDGYPIVPWVVVGAFFLGLQHRFNEVLKLFKRTREIMVWIVVSGILNVGLNWWLLPLFSYKIAAVNTLICYVFLCGAMARASRRYCRWEFPWLAAVRSLFATGVMVSGLFFLISIVELSPFQTLCLGVPVGMLIYGLTIWAVGEISPEERKAVGLSLRRGVVQRVAGL